MSWLKRLFQRRELFSDISEEIQQHLDERADELVQQGLSRELAAAQARREFGNVTSLRETSRETWQWPRLESFFSDIRYAFRQLRLQLSFAVVAIFILAIGIGANVTVFSVVDTLVLEPLPFRAPRRAARRWRCAGPSAPGACVWLANC